MKVILEQEWTEDGPTLAEVIEGLKLLKPSLVQVDCSAGGRTLYESLRGIVPVEPLPKAARIQFPKPDTKRAGERLMAELLAWRDRAHAASLEDPSAFTTEEVETIKHCVDCLLPKAEEPRHER